MPTKVARIEATPTEYRGIKFASRLEADWAATFDHLDMSWQYEPCSYRIGNENYIPDFYLDTQHVWAEVKGPMDDRLWKPREFQKELNKPWVEKAGIRWEFDTELVIVLRPNSSGACVWEGTLPEHDISLIFCDECDHYTFLDESGSWECRRCQAQVDQHGPDEKYVSADKQKFPESVLMMQRAPGWRESIPRKLGGTK